ncbi:glycosyl hydrolase family 65 protein [Marihabitans asiaticum]|uniref:Alpha,alpha-trehalose phosphorylase n=1 Tax=Marihabitans asiaticum TaxID=415218 RepID=A0A560WA78_9MICO|nr:glycosyl hydrolase family 65 protein [Marihabitans asiaticum]TWD14534.1 alpha,alpha-trehalose phosphorylase [Marihabitans asiaticum]
MSPNGATPGHPAELADPIDRTRFPVDEWRLVESSPSTKTLGRDETLFAVGNGYLGMRGNPTEGRDAHTHGTFVNGFHETWEIQHPEAAYGFAKTGQTIVSVPDGKLMKIYVDDEPLLLSLADLEHYERALNFRDGVLRREIIWNTPSRKKVRIRTSRMVSFTERHLALLTMEIEMLSGDAPVVVSSQLLNRQDGSDEYYAKEAAMGEGFDPRKTATFAHRVLEPQLDWCNERRMLLGHRVATSGMTIAVGAEHAIVTDNDWSEIEASEPDLAKKVYQVDAREGQPITITKAVTYHTSRGVPVRELADRCRRTLDRVRRRGIEHFQQEQRRWLDEYWAGCDVVVEGQPALQQAIRWNLFQLAQATARSDQLGVSAKGVTGSGYEGHYFWDTEVYVVPFLVHTMPAAARSALRARVAMLPRARDRAEELDVDGALFPWRTINGEEASAYYAAGTAQYHINADIAYALTKYVDVTGDTDFLARDGIDVLVETARMWADLGFWRGTGEERSFEIHGVTGPDEYTTVVNNNLFTNVMARGNLLCAADAVERLDEYAGDRADLVRSRLGLAEDEAATWRECAEGMCIPYDEELGVHPQDDQFLDKELWDLEGTSPEKRPLLLHFHPLVIYRFQVLKQADVVLALYLQGDMFTAEEKRRDFDYYDPITTGDSSLSAVVQSIIAAEVGLPDEALAYFQSALFTDLADLHRNTSDGVHVASTGGVWACLVSGFGGMRDGGGELTFDPRLPRAWEAMSFPLTIRGSRLRARVTGERFTVTLEDGDPVAFRVRGKEHRVSADAPVDIALADRSDRPMIGLDTMATAG